MRKSYRALEIKVGFTVFIAGVILIIGLMWFQGFKISRDYYELHAVFPQVGGIDPGDEVNVNGVERGSVKSVSLRERDVLVTMEIDSDTRIPVDSKIKLQTIGIMGQRIITILLGQSKVMLEPGAVMHGDYDPGISEAFALLGSMTGELKSLTRDMVDIARALNSGEKLKNTMENLLEITEELNNVIKTNAPRFEESMNSFNRTTTRLDSLLSRNEGRIDTLIGSLSTASRDIPDLIARADSLTLALNDIVKSLKSDTTTAGAILTNREFLNRLEQVISNLDELIADIKANPGRYMKIEIF